MASTHLNCLVCPQSPGPNIPLCELTAGPFDEPRLMYLELYNWSATVMSLGLGTPQAVGVSPVFITSLVMGDSGDTSKLPPNVGIAVDWATPPSVPSSYIRRATLESTATGVQSLRWVFPRGIRMLNASSLVLWLIASTVVIATAPTIEVNARFDV